MQEGFILERGHYNQKLVTQWIEGVPERAFWDGLKLSGRKQYNVMAFRCTRCGFLEFYTGELR